MTKKGLKKNKRHIARGRAVRKYMKKQIIEEKIGKGLRAAGKERRSIGKNASMNICKKDKK